MSSRPSIVMLVEGLKNGQSIAQHKLYRDYFEKVMRYANRKLESLGGKRREADGEDAAQQAFASVIRRIDAGHFPDLSDETSLWRILFKVTARKAQNQVRRELADKRGGGEVRGESVFLNASGDEQAGGLAGEAIARQVMEDGEDVLKVFQSLLGSFDDDELEQIAILKVQGHSNGEIAKTISKSLATVERRLKLIRAMWQEEFGLE